MLQLCPANLALSDNLTLPSRKLGCNRCTSVFVGKLSFQSGHEIVNFPSEVSTLLLVGLACHIVVLIDIEDANGLWDAGLLGLEELIDIHILDLRLLGLLRLLQLCQVPLLTNHPRHTVDAHDVLLTAQEASNHSLDVHDVAVYFLDLPKDVRMSIHLLLFLFYEFDNFFFHRLMFFSPPSANPIKYEIFNFVTCKPSLNGLGETFEFADGPED